MLSVLRIRNLGLVDELLLEFSPGFTALTGETGAGKSLIIGALGLLSGRRASRSVIRHKEQDCRVEAVFQAGSRLDAFLGENGLEPSGDGELSIARSLSRSGPGRQFVNHSPVSLSMLSRLGSRLLDIHGPHDAQSLFDSGKQLLLLDAYADGCVKRKEHQAALREWSLLEKERQELSGEDQELIREADLLRHQIGEIDRAGIDALDEEELEAEHARLSHAAQLQEGCQKILHIVSESEPSLQEQLGLIGAALEEMAGRDSRLDAVVEEHRSLTGELEQMQATLWRYLDGIEDDPRRLQELEERIDALQLLRRKYGPSMEDIREFRRKAAERLARIESREKQLARIESRLDPLRKRLESCSAGLSQLRRRKGRALAGEIRRQLPVLGFSQGRFEVELSPLGSFPPGPSGDDRIEFLFGPNPGEPLLPLRQIASSGEMARVMLALKTVLAAQDDVPLLVFDEADANIGGETAHEVGDRMRRLGRDRQVLCITHLAPVAAAASHHLQVAKEVRGRRTLVRVDPLDPHQRIEELARMLGGRVGASRRHAQALLETAGESSPSG